MFGGLDSDSNWSWVLLKAEYQATPRQQKPVKRMQATEADEDTLLEVEAGRAATMVQLRGRGSCNRFLFWPGVAHLANSHRGGGDWIVNSAATDRRLLRSFNCTPQEDDGKVAVTALPVLEQSVEEREEGEPCVRANRFRFKIPAWKSAMIAWLVGEDKRMGRHVPLRQKHAAIATFGFERPTWSELHCHLCSAPLKMATLVRRHYQLHY